MKQFITLTSNFAVSERHPVHIAIDAIQAICKEVNGSRVLVSAHNNGGFVVKETPGQILALIAQQEKQA